jgi:hypothetical protein
MTDFDDDLEMAAKMGWGPDDLTRLARIGFAPGVLATFFTLEPETRALVLRLLDSPTPQDFEELSSHPAGKSLARWLLTLPAYVNAPDEDDPE